MKFIQQPCCEEQSHTMYKTLAWTVFDQMFKFIKPKVSVSLRIYLADELRHKLHEQFGSLTVDVRGYEISTKKTSL